MNKKLIKILSAKEWKDQYSLQIVYEWEDIIAERMNIESDMKSIIKIDEICNLPFSPTVQKIIRHSFFKNYIDSSYNYLRRTKKNTIYLCHMLSVMELANHYVYQENVVPIFIDCFKNVIERLPVLCKKNRMFFVTDYEVYQQLQRSDIAAKARFIPLSISDKYLQQDTFEKSIDVLQLGRQNIVLHNWMMEVCNKFPHIEYVFASRNGETHSYFSTTRGWLNEDTDTREGFMRFLSKAKISLLSSPGIDGGDVTRTGGYNPVTPRFYESAVNYCYMVGRFPDTPDFIYNNVSSVCMRPENYDEFERTILKSLQQPFNLHEKYQPFIQQHLTSNVAKIIEREMDLLLSEHK